MHDERTEMDVDRELAGVSPRLNVLLPGKSLERVREAVRCALDEEALFDASAPAPSAETLGRVRLGVHRELARDTRLRRLGRALFAPRPRLWSPLGAAACILLCVGIIRQAGLAPRVRSPAESMSLETFLQAAEGVLAEDPFRASVLMELDEIEDALSGADLVGEYEENELRELGNEIDELFIETGSPGGMT